MSSRTRSRLYPLVGVATLMALLVTAACLTSQPPLANTLAAADAGGKAKPADSQGKSAEQSTPSVPCDILGAGGPVPEEVSAAAAALSSPVASQAPDQQGTATVPLKRVVLFSSGVGYFEHDGKVTGNAKVDLKFKVKDINDLLKSMVVQDFDGGHVSTVGYGSNDPLDKRLASFAMNLNGNPTLAQLLEQIRGEEVETDAPNKIVGKIVSIETRKTEIGKDHFIDQTVMNVASDGGLRSVILESAGAIRLLNPKLDAELHKALGVLATAHETDKKTVSLDFRGEGQRNVRVGYIEETPIWKTSYRLVLSDEKKPFLQGWAIVENPSEEDWNDVRLSLVSGRPISFTMDLYQPTYIPRPAGPPGTVQLAGPANLRAGPGQARHGVPPRGRGKDGDEQGAGLCPLRQARDDDGSHGHAGAGRRADGKPTCPPTLEPRPGRRVGGHRRQRGRAFPVCDPHPGHALAARIGHAAHPQ